MSKALEIKHIATKVTNYKTRAQTGTVTIDNEDIATLLARGGNKLQGTKEDQILQLKEWYDSDKIEVNEYSVLASLRDIINPDSHINDLVSLSTKSKVNLDYEYKRKLLPDGSTVPFKNMNEMRVYRGCSNNIRANGERIKVNNVELAVHRSKQNVKRRGSNIEFVKRHFLRALIQGVYPFVKIECTYSTILKMLKDFEVTEYQLKNAKRSPYKFNVISNDTSSRKLIRKMLDALNYNADQYKKFYEILLFKSVSNINEILEK